MTKIAPIKYRQDGRMFKVNPEKAMRLLRSRFETITVGRLDCTDEPGYYHCHRSLGQGNTLAALQEQEERHLLGALASLHRIEGFIEIDRRYHREVHPSGWYESTTTIFYAVDPAYRRTCDLYR